MDWSLDVQSSHMNIVVFQREEKKAGFDEQKQTKFQYWDPVIWVKW